MRWLFFLGIVLGVGRMAFIGILAFGSTSARGDVNRRTLAKKYQPLVSVVVPAYNEERVIIRTIESLLRSDYQRFEMIVVDDGSTDNTHKVLEDNFGGDERVSIWSHRNGGKAESSISAGERQKARSLSLDADTIFLPGTIAAGHRFADPAVGAIAGNAKVGNRINIVTRWQALEYVTSQNFDRRHSLR